MKIGAGAVLVGVAIMLTLADARATFPGDNGLIAWSSGGQLWRASPTVPTQSRSRRSVATTRPGRPSAPTWSHFAFTRNGDIFKMLAAPNGPVLEPLAANPADDRQPTYSPDGGQIVFASNRTTGGAYRLYRMPSAGGAATAITTTGALPAGTDDDAPEWNFHNDCIVFQRGVPGGLGGSLPGDAPGNTAIFKHQGRRHRPPAPHHRHVARGRHLRLLQPGTAQVVAGRHQDRVRGRVRRACGSRLFIMDANGSNPVPVSKPGGACEVSPTPGGRPMANFSSSRPPTSTSPRLLLSTTSTASSA